MRFIKPGGGGFTAGECKKCGASIYGPAETTPDEICERCQYKAADERLALGGIERSRPGASSKTIPLLLWLPTLEILRGEADTRNVSVQDIVRIAIGEYIAKLKALEQKP